MPNGSSQLARSQPKRQPARTQHTMPIHAPLSQVKSFASRNQLAVTQAEINEGWVLHSSFAAACCSAMRLLGRHGNTLYFCTFAAAAY